MVDWDDIKKPLIGAAAIVAIIGGSYLYIISGGSGGKGLSTEQKLIVEQLNKSYKDKGNFINLLTKDFKILNEAQESINSAQIYLNQGNIEKCLDEVINAKGKLSQIKTKDSKELKKDLDNADKSLTDVRKGMYKVAKEQGYLLK